MGNLKKKKNPCCTLKLPKLSRLFSISQPIESEIFRVNIQNKPLIRNSYTKPDKIHHLSCKRITSMILISATPGTATGVREKEFTLLSVVTAMTATKYISLSFTLDIDTNENMRALTWGWLHEVTGALYPSLTALATCATSFLPTITKILKFQIATYAALTPVVSR